MTRAPLFDEREECHVTGKESQVKALQEAITILKRTSNPISVKCGIFTMKNSVTILSSNYTML